ncbi:MAG TPA: hypothetical protein VF094_08780 [Gaiellaceae bacterium]
MARARPAAPPPDQLTLDDWARMLNATSPAAPESRERGEPVAQLADALAPRLAEELSRRLPPAGSPPVDASSTARLLTLDQLITQLPPAKQPRTWKRWLYERTRRGEIPGCVKLGGMLFFDREPTLAWLRAGATEAK